MVQTQTNRYVLGLTGGIGCGKSLACEAFAALGIEVVDADVIAKAQVAPGTTALEEITQHFGQQILCDNGELNRSMLATIIFKRPEEKQWLEQLLHPRIRQVIVKALAHIHSPYGILASPLLFEKQQHLLVQRTLLIDCSPVVQQQRAQQRDGRSVEQIQQIMRSQLTQAQRRLRADDIIENNQGKEALQRAVKHYHYQLLEKIV